MVAEPSQFPAGVVPVLETPFNDQGDIDPAGFGHLVEHVRQTGVSGVMFPGYASESLKLTESERAILVGELLSVTAVRPDIAGVVAVSDHASRLAVCRAERAVADGADAINLLPPYLLRPAANSVRAHVRAVLHAVAPTPVVLQLAPAEASSPLRPVDIASLAADNPNLIAVKVDGNPAGPMVTALAERAPEIVTAVGYAGLSLPDAAQRGARGVWPGCSFTEVYVELWRRWTTADLAGFTELHRRLLPYLSVWMQHVEMIVAVEKQISMDRGLIATAVCREPRRCLDRHEHEQVRAFVTEFKEWWQ